jgi:flagellar assembly FlgT-like protein
MFMRAKIAALCLTLGAGAAVCSAQTAPETAAAAGPAGQPGYSKVYCSGFLKDTKVPDEARIVSGEQIGYKIYFDQGERVYLNQGSNKGVRVGDRFLVVRPVHDVAGEWFRGQERLSRAMGALYADLGQVKVVNVQPKTSIAEVIYSCDPMQRGDIVRPFEERPVPPYKEIGVFDHFAPVSGKPVGMMVSSVDFQQGEGQGSTVYVNLGAAQGVKVGDYLRFFRHQGKLDEYAPQTRGYQYELYGYGSSPTRYGWGDLPREVLGEGIVLNASRNGSTVLITFSSADIYTGDNAEIE